MDRIDQLGMIEVRLDRSPKSHVHTRLDDLKAGPPIRDSKKSQTGENRKIDCRSASRE